PPQRRLLPREPVIAGSPRQGRHARKSIQVCIVPGQVPVQRGARRAICEPLLGGAGISLTSDPPDSGPLYRLADTTGRRPHGGLVAVCLVPGLPLLFGGTTRRPPAGRPQPQAW